MTMQSTPGCACPNDRYTRFPNWLLGKVTGLEIAVLVALQSHYPNIHPSLATLSKESGLSQSTVQRVLGDLQRKGLVIKRQTQTKHGTKGVNSYRLLIWDQPVAGTESEKSNPVKSNWSERPINMVTETTGVWSERPVGMVRETNKQEQFNKNKDLTRKEPPFIPPVGERRAERVDTHLYQDQGDFFHNPDPGLQATAIDPNPEAAQPQPNQPFKPWESPQQPPQPEAPEPRTSLAHVPVNPPAQKRKAGFVPTAEDVPAALLPVVSELLEFWASKGGKRTERAWSAQMGQLSRVQQDPSGGTESVRAQLVAGAQAAIFGKPWQAVTYANWQRFRWATPIRGTGFNRRMTQDDHAAEALAFIKARDARRAAEAAQQAQQSQQTPILAEVA